MMRSMFSAISGLRAHQTMLDVTANNIANVNTVGYKAQRASFKEALSQMQRNASSPTTTLGGTNPAAVGLGVQLGSIDQAMTAGALQSTGNPLDLAIQGEGFFRLKTWNASANAFGGSTVYTRSGNFTTDQQGYLVTQDGYYVVGYAYANGALTTTETRLQLPTNSKLVSVGQDGLVTVVDASGAKTTIGALTLAKFPNAAGLERVSSNRYQETQNSGTATVGTPGDASGFAALASGALEMSNVDLAQEFTNMITAQRGFGASSRIITTADEMLQQLVNLGR